MKDKYITLEELKQKEAELIAEYNENINKGLKLFADNALENLKSVRYIIKLIEN